MHSVDVYFYTFFKFFFKRRRERHAKTIDIAQEEVLTCLGIHLYERLHRIWQKLRAEEQTWQILFHLGIDALRKSFEVLLSLCFVWFVFLTDSSADKRIMAAS